MNIKKIIREEIDDESNEFKWIEDTDLGSLYVGALMLIDKNSGTHSRFGGSPDEFILLKITVISEEDNKVYYITEDSNMQSEVIKEEGKTDLDWAKELIEDGYWQPLFPGNDAHKAYYDTYLFHKKPWLKEGKDDFDWMGEKEVFTFGEIYDLGLLDVGDTIWLSGKMEGDVGMGHYTLNSVKFVIDDMIHPDRFYSIEMSTDDMELKKWLRLSGVYGSSDEIFDVIQSDGELIVVGFKPLSDWDNRLTEQDDFGWIEDIGEGNVDLRDANPGDMLISQHGLVLTYIGPYPQMGKKWHKVKYPQGKNPRVPSPQTFYNPMGARTDDGYVSANNRLETDHDIVAIIKSKPINDQ